MGINCRPIGKYKRFLSKVENNEKLRKEAAKRKTAKKRKDYQED